MYEQLQLNHALHSINNNQLQQFKGIAKKYH